MTKKVNKRANGEGTISQRKDGRWEGKITVGHDPATGKPKRLTFYGKTQREVREKMDKAKAEIQNGTFAMPDKTTLGTWIQR